MSVPPLIHRGLSCLALLSRIPGARTLRAVAFLLPRSKATICGIPGGQDGREGQSRFCLPQPHFLYSCWLRVDNYFIWSFIGPVSFVIVVSGKVVPPVLRLRPSRKLAWTLAPTFPKP